MPTLTRFTPLETTCAQAIAAGYLALTATATLLPPGYSAGTFPTPALGYLAGTFATWTLISWQLWNHRAEAGEGVLGPATGLTLLRAWLVAVVGGHVFLPPLTGTAATVVALVYTSAAILDNVDGRVARRTAQTSALGARLDVRADALGLVVAPLVAVHAGRLPPWYLLLAVAFPFMRLALRFREWRGLPVYRQRLRPNRWARLFAGVQMGVVATALYPVLPTWLLWPAATLAMMPTLWLFVGEWRVATSAELLSGAE
jgi:CDP-diacylglycerol--glycerol-3-phosphate 3-phosphatidyltransferase